MASSTLRRALLYVPSSSAKFLEKSRTLTVDTVSYDLEDSVTISSKPSARKALASFLSSPRPSSISELSVRINAVETGLALEDLKAILPSPNLDTIVVPKVQSAADLHFVTDVIKHTLPERHPAMPAEAKDGARPPLKIVALIESAKAITDLKAICGASPLLDGLIFAAEDFALDLSVTRSPSLHEFLYARSAIVAHAKAAELSSTIDLVCTSFKGDEGLRTLEEECAGGRGMGFNGKQCIHPSQVEVVQKAFAPSEKEVEWAVRVMIGDKKADEQNRGAWTLDGKMIDAPVSGKARSVVKRAQRCGIDVEAVMEKWKDQEPQ